MALMVTPAMEQLSAAVQTVLGEEPGLLNDLQLLGNGETLLRLRHQLDYVFSTYVNAMWANETTTDVVGQSVKGWLHNDQHLSNSEAGRRVATARGLLDRPMVAAAFKAGSISLDHASTVIRTVRDLPVEVQEVAEKELTDAATFTDPARLASACKDLRDHLGLNGTAEEQYAKLYGRRYLKVASTIDGMVKLDAMLDPDTGAKLKAAFASLSVKEGADDDRDKPQRDHDAFASILGYALRVGDLPDTGGEPPQVIVTISLEELIHGLDRMHTPMTAADGSPLTPGRIRMAACDAGIIPAVLRGESEVLDLGRESRTWNRAQRRAARLRDGQTCTWPGGCTTPIRYCQLHHLEFWVEHDGPTNHTNSAHVCTYHHWLVHNKNWQLWRDPDGTLHNRRT